MASGEKSSLEIVEPIRYGREIDPKWTLGSESTAPAGNSALVTKTVSTGKSGYIYGFIISAQEANNFKINWTYSGTTKSMRLVFATEGSLAFTDPTPINESLPADAGTSITITNVTAGNAGKVYQAMILVGEV
jgi:hypothetical protein